jgi:two-component system cell cycle response regulator
MRYIHEAQRTGAGTNGGQLMDSETKPKILIAEDEEAVITFYSAALREQGYEVQVARDGDQALEVVGSADPDLLLLDLSLPGRDGFQVLETIKADPASAGIPVIMLTSAGSTEDKVRGLEAGADDFMVKSFDLQELLARIKSLLKIKRLHDQMKQASQARAAQEAPAAREASAGQVLVVEDDPNVAKICRYVLGMGGFETHVIADGNEAAAYVSIALPDLVVLDLLLPGIHGLDLLRMMKESSVTADIPVIILSGVDDLNTKMKGLMLGADDYLVKPINSIELLARVRSNIRKYRRYRSVSAALEETAQHTISDQLTGLYTREYFDLVCDRDIALYQRGGPQFALLLIELGFDPAADEDYLMTAGQMLLVDTARILKNEIRNTDVAARYGENLFAVLLDISSLPMAVSIAQRIRDIIGRGLEAAGQGRPVALNLGATQISKRLATREALMSRLAEALAKSRSAGGEVAALE